MGAFDEKPPIVLPDPGNPETAAAFRKRWGWEDHEQVMIKGVVTVSDQEYVSNHYGKADRRGQIEISMGTGRYALLDRMIINWTFLANGMPVKVSPETIRRLPANYSNPILEEIDRLAATMTEDEQSAFLIESNGHIGGDSESGSLSLMKL